MKINYRQLSILVFMSFVALKFLALPSLLYVESKNMSWLVALVLMVLDAIYVFILLDLMKKSGQNNFYNFLKQCIGTMPAKIILIVLGLKYALVVANLSKGLEFFVVENFYERLNWVVFVLPLIILTGFMVYKGSRNIARVSEIICWPIILGCLYLAVKSIMGVEPLNFLPFLEEGIKPLAVSGFKHISWFGSCTFMFMLFGKVDFNNEKKSTMIKYIIISILLVQLIFIIFYGLFDVTSPTHNYCISDISQFSSGRSSIDELSWLVVSLWVSAQAVQLALYSYCLVQVIKFLFNVKSNAVPIFIVLLYIFMWSFIGEQTIRLENVFLTPYASIVTIVSQYVFPVFLLSAYHIKNAIFKHKHRQEVVNAIE